MSNMKDDDYIGREWNYNRVWEASKMKEARRKVAIRPQKFEY